MSIEVATCLPPESSHPSTRELDIVPDVDVYRRSGPGIRLVQYIF